MKAIEKLERFLFKHAKNPASARRAWERLQPFLRILDQGYDLKPLTGTGADALKNAFAMIEVRSVSRIVRVAVAEPFRLPDWASERATSLLLGQSIKDGVEFTDGGASTRTSWFRPERTLKDQRKPIETDVVMPLCDLVETAIAAPLADALVRRYAMLAADRKTQASYTVWREDLGEIAEEVNALDVVWGRLLWSFQDLFLAYLGLAIIDDRDNMSRLEPILELLPHFVPLGEQTGEPGAWLVLTA